MAEPYGNYPEEIGGDDMEDDGGDDDGHAQRLVVTHGFAVRL